MISVITYANLGKGKYRVSFDNGMTCVLYRGEAARLSLSEGCLITEEQYDILINEIIGKRARKRAMHLLEKMDMTEYKLREKLKRNDYPDECIDYVVLHEIAHIKHHNHSKEFYAFIEKYMPDYKERVKLLRSL